MLLFSIENALATDCLAMCECQKGIVFSRFSAIFNVFRKKVIKLFGGMEKLFYLCTRKQGNSEVNTSNLRANDL